MQHINELFNIDSLDLLTKAEKDFNKMYVEKLKAYAKGELNGIMIRNLTSGASTIAKRQQSRSGVAMLKWSIALKQSSGLPELENNIDPTKEIPQ